MIRRNKIILITFVCIFVFAKNAYITSYAVDTYRVSTAQEAVQWLNETQCLIPLYITGNKGIMGFRISLEYDSDKLHIDSVSNGLVTRTGSFNYGDAVDIVGQVDVVWYSTEDVTSDGTIMYIGVTIEDISSDSIEIKISYNGEDTFNEAWEDVILNCDNIVVASKHNTENNAANVAPELKAVIENEEENLYCFNAATDFNAYNSMNDIGEDIIKSAVITTMEGYGIDSMSKLTDGQEEQFWNDVRETLVNDYGADIFSVNNLKFDKIAEQITITSDDVVSIKNYEGEEIASKSDVKNIEKPSMGINQTIIVCIIACVLLMGLVVALLFKNKTKTKK